MKFAEYTIRWRQFPESRFPAIVLDIESTIGLCGHVFVAVGYWLDTCSNTSDIAWYTSVNM